MQFYLKIQKKKHNNLLETITYNQNKPYCYNCMLSQI